MFPIRVTTGSHFYSSIMTRDCCSCWALSSSFPSFFPSLPLSLPPFLPSFLPFLPTCLPAFGAIVFPWTGRSLVGKDCFSFNATWWLLLILCKKKIGFLKLPLIFLPHSYWVAIQTVHTSSDEALTTSHQLNHYKGLYVELECAPSSLQSLIPLPSFFPYLKRICIDWLSLFSSFSCPSHNIVLHGQCPP